MHSQKKTSKLLVFKSAMWISSGLVHLQQIVMGSLELHFIFKYQIKCRQHSLFIYKEKISLWMPRCVFSPLICTISTALSPLLLRNAFLKLFSFFCHASWNKSQIACWRHLIWYLEIKCNSTEDITICCKWTKPLLIHSAD